MPNMMHLVHHFLSQSGSYRLWSLVHSAYFSVLSRLQSDFNVFLSCRTSVIDHNLGQFHVKSLWIYTFKLLWMHSEFRAAFSCHVSALWLAQARKKRIENKVQLTFPLHFPLKNCKISNFFQITNWKIFNLI